MRIVAAISVALAACGPSWAQDQGAPGAPRAESGAKAIPVDVSGVLHPIREKAGLPGMAVVVTRGREIIAQGVSGVRKAGDDTPVTIEDRWHLGSCTKSMTATLCAVLVEEGKLKWGSTLGEVFPDVEMDKQWAGVTLEQLLAHRAGMPANLDRAGAWAGLRASGATTTEQRLAVVRDTLKSAPKYEPGTKSEYSNIGFTVAGAMAEKVSGRAWEDLMREKLFEPLRMSSAGFGAPGTKKEVDEPWGHNESGAPSQSDNPAVIGPAGTVHASLPDWAKYVAVHTGGHRPDRAEGVWLLKPETIAKLHTAYAAPGADYGFGWGIVKRPWGKGPGGEGRVLTHAGSNTMWYCVVWAAPELDMAVLVATNKAGPDAGKACDDAAGAMIQRFIRPMAPR